MRVDLSPADVVTMWFLTNSNDRLRPNLEKQLKPGARVVSNEFPIRGWKPADVVHVKIGKMEHTIYVYEIGKQNDGNARRGYFGILPFRSRFPRHRCAPGSSRSWRCCVRAVFVVGGARAAGPCC